MIVIEIIFIACMLYVIWLMVYSLVFGAPYAAIGKKRLAAMLNLAKIKKGDKAADLGSGDGRIVMALAKAGALADGYEINPLLYILSKYRIRKEGVRHANIFLKDLWKKDLSIYDVVTLYGNFPMMGRLEKKLQTELRPGSKVVSNHFQFPNWKYAKKERDVYLYIK
jgi:cyclopropane fatty-acyl-phospholipid synthase-like methyltransferase